MIVKLNETLQVCWIKPQNRDEKLRHAEEVFRETSWGDLGIWYFSKHVQTGWDPKANSGKAGGLHLSSCMSLKVVEMSREMMVWWKEDESQFPFHFWMADHLPNNKTWNLTDLPAGFRACGNGFQVILHFHFSGLWRHMKLSAGDYLISKAF